MRGDLMPASVFKSGRRLNYGRVQLEKFLDLEQRERVGRRVSVRAIALLLLLVWTSFEAIAQQERRLALVLANEDYPTALGRLTNTHEDADRVEAALRDIGFSVTKVLDANASGLRDAITEFELAIDREAADGDYVVAFVYASMHGAAADVDGRTRNFLLPAKEPIRSTGELLRKAVRIDQLISGLSSTEAKAIIIVSDACRNNLGTSFSKSTTKGFVPVGSRPGVLVAYATAPGATTPDDGLFADLLARQLREPGRKASFAMLEAIESVARLRTLDGQPFLSSGGLPDWLCFNGCEQKIVASPASPLLASDEATALAQAISANTISSYTAFRERFPRSSNLEFINHKITELRRFQPSEPSATENSRPERIPKEKDRSIQIANPREDIQGLPVFKCTQTADSGIDGTYLSRNFPSNGLPESLDLAWLVVPPHRFDEMFGYLPRTRMVLAGYINDQRYKACEINSRSCKYAHKGFHLIPVIFKGPLEVDPNTGEGRVEPVAIALDSSNLDDGLCRTALVDSRDRPIERPSVKLSVCRESAVPCVK